MRARSFAIATLVAVSGCAENSLGAHQYLPGTASFEAPAKPGALVVTSASDHGSGSLREAVTDAKSGSTVTFALRKGAKIALTTAIPIAKTITLSGPGSTGLTISGNKKSQIFIISRHAKVTVSGLTLAAGRGAQGGAIYNAGSLTLSNDRFLSNLAPGGIVPYGASAPDPRFDPRRRRSGDRPRRHPAAPRPSAASASGAGMGGAIYNAGKLVVATCNFVKNVAGGRTTQSDGAGGAIAQSGGSAKITGSTFSSNFAGGGGAGSWGMGGAVYSTGGTLSLTNDTFSGNKAGGTVFGYGGAVYGDQHVSSTKSQFSGNGAFGTANGSSAYGGAIYAGGGVSAFGGEFSSNSAAGGSSGGNGYGGAVDSESSSILTTAMFTGNTAAGGSGGSAEGGAIYLAGGTSTWTSVSFSGNVAAATGANSYASGGGAAVFGALTVTGASSFSANIARVASGGSFGAQGGAIAFEGETFSFAGTASNNSATTQGGALWIDGAATVSNALLSRNTVSSVQSANDGGGGMYLSLGAALSMSGTTLTANSTSGAVANTGGGAVFNEGAGTIINSTVEGNSSSGDGGGIENDAAGGFSLANVTVYQNTAGRNGGNLKNAYADASVTIANSIFAGGSANGQPNDISNDGTTVSGDYNIIQTAAAGNALVGSTSHNLASDPRLSAIASNGGPTPTNADGPTSPGTAYIPFNECLAVDVFVDQRGYPRDATVNGYCDVGAYEDQTP